MSNVAADTFNYDTAFVMPISEVNEAIKNACSSPTIFTSANEASSLSGTFGDWSLVTGGGGAILRMSIPITQSTMTFLASKAYPNPSPPIDFAADTVAIFNFTLDYFDSPDDVTPPPSGSNMALMVNSDNSDPGNPPVWPYIITPGYSDSGVQDIFTGLLNQWLNDNISDFKHIFASVNINRVADKGQFSWLLPSTTDYAYTDVIGDSQEGYLGVLCMTDGRSNTGLTPIVSTAAIPSGSTSGFLISPMRFLDEIIMPTLPIAFNGSETSNFTIAEDDLSIGLTDQQSFTMSNAVNHAGIEYDVEVTSVSIQLQNNQLEVIIDTKVEVSPGIWSLCTHTAKQEIALGVVSSTDSQTLTFNTIGKPTTVNSTETSPGIAILKEILAIIAAIVVLLVTVFTDGLGLLALAGIAALTAGVAATPEVIAALGEDYAPSLDLLALNISDPITWTGSSAYTLNFAGINGGLQLGSDTGLDD